MRLAVAIAGLLAACSVPPLKLEFDVSSGLDKSCGASACTGVHLACDAVASIRILDPSQPSAPYISQCQRIILDSKKDLCSLAGIDLKQDPLPEQTLEVEVVIYEASQIATDPVSGDLVCPTEKEGLTFDAASGFPTGTIAMVDPADPTKMLYPTPAIGGRAFWHPGDSSVVVDLACNDLGALNSATCAGSGLIEATATVTDFDNPVSVSSAIADLLTVRIGEPKLKPGGTDIDFVLNASDTRVLDRTLSMQDPAWGASIDLMFEKAACLEILEDGAMATATLTCKPVAPPIASVDINGFRLYKGSLDELLTALGNPPLDQGLVIGMVVDYAGSPAPPHSVIATTPVAGQTATIEYLTDMGDGRMVVGGTTTTSSGIFISRDAPFGTIFSTQNTPGAPIPTVTGFGGRVEGKVTIVMLQLAKKPTTQ